MTARDRDLAIVETAAGQVERLTEVRREEALLKAGALQSAIFSSANFSSIATDANGIIRIFNRGAERMLGYTAGDVMNRITPTAPSTTPSAPGRTSSASPRARHARLDPRRTGTS